MSFASLLLVGAPRAYAHCDGLDGPVVSAARDDVAAGRAFVESYVEYVHWVEGLYEAATPVSEHTTESGKTE